MSNNHALQPCTVLVGDEILLLSEAADRFKQRATELGCNERTHMVMDARSDWAALLAESQNVSLFGDLRLLEISLPTGKPGKTGALALEKLVNMAAQNKLSDLFILIRLPALDRTTKQSKWAKALQSHADWHDIPSVSRQALPRWIAQRLSQQNQQANDISIAWLSDKVEGNLLAAHQELQKLALIYPAGELSLEQIQSAVLNVARYNPYDLRDAMLQGETKRALGVLSGLRAEGEALTLVLWAISEEIRILNRLAWAGQKYDSTARKLRVFGQREKTLRKALNHSTRGFWITALRQAHEIDRLIKGVPSTNSLNNAWDEMARLIIRVSSTIQGY